MSEPINLVPDNIFKAMHTTAAIQATFNRRCGLEAIYAKAGAVLMNQGIIPKLRGKYRLP